MLTTREIAAALSAASVAGAIAWGIADGPVASVATAPPAPIYDPMDDVDFAADCQPCPNDPWLYCCKSLSTIQLAPETQEALAKVAKLERRDEVVLNMIGAVLKSVNDLDAKVKALTPKKRSGKRTAKAGRMG